MIIIWGSRVMDKTLGYSGIRYQCSNCNNASQYRIFRRRKWFTLFWIPIFPFSSEYYICCPICNFGQKISKEEAEKQLAMTSQEQSVTQSQE